MRFVLVLFAMAFWPEFCRAADRPFAGFLSKHCYVCHSGDTTEGRLDLKQLSTNMTDAKTAARWEKIFDRVDRGEMPPQDAEQPAKDERDSFRRHLGTALTVAHEKVKGTVLRRLNRIEFQNTLNDLFGTNVDLRSLLPEDGRSHEFDTVGKSLGISMVHLQRYIQAIERVLDTAIAATTEAPKPTRREASFAGTSEAKRFVGKVWKRLSDGAIVRFNSGGYPTGMIRGSGVRTSGRYRLKVTGYAHQSSKPITFLVGGTSFARGSEKPIYGFYSFPPGRPGKHFSIELETWIERNYMVRVSPFGIADPDRYRRKSIANYKGPGLAILKVEIEGPLVGSFPSRGHRLIFDGLKRKEIPPRNPRDRFKRWYKPRFDIVSTNEQGDATLSLRRVATAAFRRPATDTDIIPFLKLFQAQRRAGESFESALRTSVIAIFCSPRFLFLQEKPGKLDDYALASRLSYFLTRTTPDAQLLAAAKRGKLRDARGLRNETERLLKHAKFQRFVEDFCDSWLNLREIDFTVPDRSLFPEFDDYLRWSIPRETHAFLRELIESNLSAANVVKSDFAMLNSRLAMLYELPAVTGSHIRKVKLPPGSVRGGFLSQGSVLKVTANGTNSSPVTRGAWVLERILGETPDPPPPGIPGVEPDIRGASTLRELLDKHRNVASCKSCHQKIDPPGFALESFNPIGGFRRRYRSLGKGDRVSKIIGGRRVRYRLGPSVDSSGKLVDGRKFADFKQFRDHLAKDANRLTKTLAKKLLTFATGRELGFSDRAEIERVVQASASKGHGVRDLIHLVVQSEIFRKK